MLTTYSAPSGPVAGPSMPLVKVPSLTWSRAMKVSAATAVQATVISAAAAMRARMVWRAMAATSV
ncbi:hypothetical protein [Stenotrophomonas sp.]|uniref:hypothetical protein n=1 Tax=Stenotrophomonas sp. TaxID=69392 RepID=UPI0028AECE97|nr:hypothetical protein [Stenotrophomonas sp.]